MNEMQDIVDVQPINLDSFIEERPLKPLPYPDKALKNRAAQTALLTDVPERIPEQYQAMLAEAQSGQETTRNSILNKRLAEKQPKDIGAIMSILADQTLPMEAKQAAIASLNSDWTKDTSVLLATETYEQPSKGESIEAENVRISGAEQFKGNLEYKRYVQSVKNRHELGFDGKSVSDFLAVLAPFSVNKYGVSTLKPIVDEMNLKISKGESAILPGSAMEKISEVVKNIPPSKRLEIAQKITGIVEQHSGLILNSDNDFVALTQLQQALEGDYSKFDKFVDNTSGILDTIGLGGTVKWFKNLPRTKLFSRSSQIEEAKIAQRGVSDTVSPVSSVSILKDSNPEKARNAYSLIVGSRSDAVAEALTGTTRTEAVASQVVPQPLISDGSVATKLIDPLREVKTISPDSDLLSVYRDRGGIELTTPEIKRAEANITNDFRNVNGITLHDNLLSVGNTGNQFHIKAMYGGTEGGFLKADEALEQVKFSLREYGVQDYDLQLFKKIEDEYVPISFDEAKGLDGDYLVGLDLNHQINPLDIGKMDELNVKRNWLDRLPVFRSKDSGSASRHILDAASMLHPRITGAAAVATDRSTLIDKRLLHLHDSFAKQYKKFEADRQAKIYDYIKEANLRGIELDDLALSAKFTTDEIGAIKAWRKAWDTHYWFENADLVRTMNIQGYQLFDNGTDKLFAKAAQKNKNIKKAYDPDTGSVVSLSQKELDDLYDKGGTYAAFRRPTDINGEVVEHMIVRNNATSYLRGIRESDQVLAYKKGYYQVQYNAPKFITQRMVTANGGEYYKAVGVAGDTEEAEQIRRRISTTEGVSLDDLVVRADMRDMKVDTDAYWDMQNASGRIAQRHRGKRLENTTNPLTGFDSQYLLDPVESAIRASRNLSSRVATREFLEISKQRAIQQYGEYFPKDITGKPMWLEDSRSLVGNTGTKYDKKLADARTTVEYLNYLQHGYENSFDEGFKGLFNALASQAAGISSTLERGLMKVGSIAPTQFLKSGVFTAYLALNPLRQWIIQSHQSVRMMGLNPSYVLTGKLADDVRIFGMDKLGFAPKAAKDKEMVDYINSSGMLDAVDKQNLVRGPLNDLVESEGVIKRGFGKAIEIPRKIGFDMGEQTNLLSHLLTVRDRAIKAGKNVNDPRVRDELYSEARALSYDMNFAGDMPYNQNSMGLFLQFFQVPHKALTSVTTNRRISTTDKMRLAATDTLLWGVPGAAVLSNMVSEDMLPENAEAREAVVFGLESFALNNALSKLVGKDANINFSAFSPYNMEGFAHLFTAVATGGYAEYITNSPSFSLYFREGSRMREAFGKLLRYTGFVDTQAGLEVPEALDVLNSFAEAGSSGWSNYLKAKAIMELGQVRNTKGGTMLEDAGYIEAAAKLFGFGTQEEVIKYGVTRALREGSTAHRDEVLKSYNTYIKLLAKETKLSNTDPEWTTKVLGAMKLMWKNDLVAQEIINSQLSKDLVSYDHRIIRDALNDAKLLEASSPATINNLKMLKNDELNKALQLMNDIREQAKIYGDK